MRADGIRDMRQGVRSFTEESARSETVLGIVMVEDNPDVSVFMKLSRTRDRVGIGAAPTHPVLLNCTIEKAARGASGCALVLRVENEIDGLLRL